MTSRSFFTASAVAVLALSGNPAFAETDALSEVMLERNPALRVVYEQSPDKAAELADEVFGLLEDVTAENPAGQNAGGASELSEQDKETLEENPLFKQVYEHNPHGMAELLRRIRDAGN